MTQYERSHEIAGEQVQVSQSDTNETIDGFEDEDLVEYQVLTNSNFTVTSSSGRTFLESAVTNDMAGIVSMNGLQSYPEQTDRFTFEMRVEDPQANLGGSPSFCFGVQSATDTTTSGVPENCYRLLHDSGNLILKERVNGSETDLAETSASLNAWLTIDVMWYESGTIRVEITNQSDGSTSTIVGNSTAFTGGGIGFTNQFLYVQFDNIEIHRPDTNIQVGEQNPVNAMLAQSLRTGKPLADDGALHNSIQEAEYAANSFVFVPPGTFNEHVDIHTDGLRIAGCGRSTIIDGTDGYSIQIYSADNIIENLSVTNQTSSGYAIETVSGSGATSGTIQDIYIDNVNYRGIYASEGSNWTIRNIISNNSGDTAIQPIVPNTIVSNCIIRGTGRHGITVAGNGCIVSNCYISDSGDGRGIYSVDDNCILIGNRIHNSSLDGLEVQGANCIVANNRISDSNDQGISDQGTSTTLDANLIGPSN
jgi:parallel beta-helix repeat protein